MSASRERILARVRAAVADAPEAPEPARDYLESHTSGDPAEILELLHENLADYRAIVHRATEGELPALIAELLDTHRARSVVVPDGLPEAWLADTTAEQRTDDGPLTPYELDAIDAVVTGCSLAIAETGTIVLDAGPGQGAGRSRSFPICTSASSGPRADRRLRTAGDAAHRPDPPADLDLRSLGHQRHRARPGRGRPRPPHP